jgi:soluble lytic murein transglycosylase
LRLVAGGLFASLALGPGALGQQDYDGDEAPPAAAPAVAKPAGKPVPFDKDWLEPYFTKGPAKDGLDRFREEDWAGAEAGFLKATRALKKGQPKTGEQLAAQFMLGLARENLSKWKDAGDLFEALYAAAPKLGTYHAYHAARCRLRAGDAAGALGWAEKVIPGTVPEAETALVRIDALRALSRWEDALAALDAYLAKYPNGPRRAEATFRRAEALEKTGAKAGADVVADATALYRRVWAEAPLEAWADRAAERLEAIAQSRPAEEARLVRTHTAGEWVARGMGYFNANRNVESEQAFIAALAAPGLDKDLECRARFHRAQSVWKQRQRSRGAPLFDDADGACFRAGNRDLHAKALYQGARCYASMGARDQALARYARVEAEHADHSYADDARLRSAEIATDAGDLATANVLLADVPRRYPKGDLLNEALWRLAFAAWRAGDDANALRWLDENLRLVPHEEIWYAEGRALYWKARVLERQGKPDDARHFYERAAREYPLSVYALLALTRLQGVDGNAAANLVASLRAGIHDVPAWTFSPRPLFGDEGFLRAVELARMGLGGEARRELARLGLATSADKHAGPRGGTGNEEEDLLWITAVLLDRGGSWAASHSIPRYGINAYRLDYPQGLGEAKWRIAYPRAFPALVAKNAKANDLPEALQLAIMREESAFSPRIESFANAIGLTQMLVKTAKRFSNGAPVTREVLLDPAHNVELGSRFLGFLWKRFKSTPPLTIAGYNAGESAVEKWLGERGNLATDEFMETIPYDETRNYTKRVLASFFAYSWLYGEAPVPTVPLALGRGGATPTKTTATSAPTTPAPANAAE